MHQHEEIFVSKKRKTLLQVDGTFYRQNREQEQSKNYLHNFLFCFHAH